MTVSETRSGEVESPAPPPARYTQPFLDWAARYQPANEPDRIKNLRELALEHFRATGFPSIRDEEWKFTNAAPIARIEWSPVTNADTAPEVARAHFLDGADHLVFVNGVLRPQLSSVEVSEATVVPLSSAMAGEVDTGDALLSFGERAPYSIDGFVALNTALWTEGVLVDVPPGAVIERPLHLLFLSTASSETPEASFPRVLIRVGDNAHATIVESFVGLDDEGAGTYLTCPVTEITAGNASVVDHYKVQKESLTGHHMACQRIHLGRSANFSSHSIQWGGKLVRTDVVGHLGGEGTTCTLNGIYVLAGKQHSDNHMRVEHAAPHCFSYNMYKGILDERARAVFTGRIFVHEGAQKTDAFQDNRNLLLSRHALVNSNPQLEIFADDVKCSHGSATGQIDEEAMFYLRSRGIEETAAKSLLTYAFAREFVDRVKLDVLRRDLDDFLFSRLPGGEIVRQAT